MTILVTIEQKAKDLKEIKKAYKPMLTWTICSTLVALAPYLHLILNIIDQKYEKLLPGAILAAIGIIYSTVVWVFIFFNGVNTKMS
ncbi:putative membrane protein [Natronobacillus azotifigens]|uniref:Uncharacterized protein n=1 Tax=Natronobacillus azotifigens TaxID=472978 RepID=A0A9J6R9W5_9BACI|nr:hypothetical protein [Natronobacillus azotifigens]MCZ0702084.1 hypothetical protein [Natronobacillus azotifigens]